MEAKQFVEELYKESANNDTNSIKLANLLNVLTMTVFGDANRFVFELLQNADDSSDIEKNNKVEIRIINGYIVFSHNGKHFTKDDVVGISNIGSGNSGKGVDAEKTGYKGIGFKSVFGNCDKVYIFSKDFSFKFDKYHYLWSETDEYPWQTIPIYVDKSELPFDLIEYIDFKRVNTIICVDNAEKIKMEILSVFRDHRIMLFLRNINEVKVFNQKKNLLTIRRNILCDDMREIALNDSKKSAWIYKENIIPVSEELRVCLQTLNDQVCPKKLKEASSTKIAFAAQIDGDEIVPLGKDSVLYSYLPTKTSYDFPFLINADFILNAERTHLLSNAWNNFLFEQIALFKLKWLQEIVEGTNFKYQFSRLIKLPFPKLLSDTMKKAYNESLSNALRSIRFIPNVNNKLIKIHESIIDTTGISEAINSSMITDLFSEEYQVVHNKVSDYKKLRKLGAKECNIKEFCDLYFSKNIIIKNKEMIANYSALLSFMYSYDQENKSNNWQVNLKSVPCILNEKFQVTKPEQLYFPLDGARSELSDYINLEYINSEVYNLIKSKGMKKWLKTLGVSEVSDIEIIRKSIFNMISTNRINADNSIHLMRFIFRVYKTGQFTGNDYKKLMEMKLITNKGLISTHESYLSDFYNPDTKIQSFLPEGIYVIDDYVENESDIPTWRNLLTQLRVKERIQIHKKKSIKRNEMLECFPITKGYLDYIDRMGYVTGKANNYKFQHSLENVMIIDHMKYLGYYEFSLIFWKSIINNNWEEIKNSYENTCYRTYVGVVKVESFISYFVKHNKSIPANDNTCYRSVDVYSNKLEFLIKDSGKIVSNEIKLTTQQEEILGIKTSIEIDFTIEILSEICLNEPSFIGDDIKRIDGLYKQVIKCLKTADGKVSKKPNSDLKLLNTHGSFTKPNQLYIFKEDSLRNTYSSERIMRIPESIDMDDIELLCSYLGVNIIQASQLSLNVVERKSDEMFKQHLNSKILSLTRLISSVTSDDPKRVLQQASKAINNISYINAQNLTLIYRNDLGELIYEKSIKSWFNSDIRCIYYTGSYQNQLTIYSLSDLLAKVLMIPDYAREVGLLLQLSKSESEEWLVSKGYNLFENSLEGVELNELIIDTEKSNIDDELICDDLFELSNPDVDSDVITDELKNTEKMGEKRSVYYDYQYTSNDSNNISKNNDVNDKSNFKQITTNTTSKSRLVSYVYEERLESNEDMLNNHIDIKALTSKSIEIVLKYEMENNRNPEVMPKQQEAYNIISRNSYTGEVERYIRVNGFIREWNYHDVAWLSPIHAKFSCDNPDLYWMYAVEFVEDPTNSRIYRIKNPFTRITKYAFDYGWKSISESEDPLDKFIVGAKINHKSFGIGVINEVLTRGMIIMLMVDFEDCKRRVPLNLTQMKIIER